MRCKAFGHGRSVIRLSPQASYGHVWISDSFLAEAFERFTTRILTHQKRHGSNVPGPLEARRRGTKRRHTHLAHGQAANSGFFATLFGSPRQTITSRYEPPSLRAEKTYEQPTERAQLRSQSIDPVPCPLDTNQASPAVQDNDHDFEHLEADASPVEYTHNDSASRPTRESQGPISSSAQGADAQNDDLPETPPGPPRKSPGLQEASISLLVDDVPTAGSTLEPDTVNTSQWSSISPRKRLSKEATSAKTHRKHFNFSSLTDMEQYVKDLYHTKHNGQYVQEMIQRFKSQGPREAARLLGRYLNGQKPIHEYDLRISEASCQILMAREHDRMHDFACLMIAILQHHPYPVIHVWKAILLTIYHSWGSIAVLQFVKTVRAHRPFPGILFLARHTFIIDMLQQETEKVCADPDPDAAARMSDLIKVFQFPQVFMRGLDVIPFRLIGDGKIGALEVMELIERPCVDKRLTWEDVGSEVRVSEARAHYIYDIADALSSAPNYTHAQAFRGVVRCYYFLQYRRAPITAEFTRSLVRAGITRCLLNRRWVANVKLLWILRIVERVEGPQVAYALEKLVYDWRERLLKEAAEIYRQVGRIGEVRVNTAANLVLYDRAQMEENNVDDGDLDDPWPKFDCAQEDVVKRTSDSREACLEHKHYGRLSFASA